VDVVEISLTLEDQQVLQLVLLVVEHRQVVQVAVAE
jgi:hypothetical protein